MDDRTSSDDANNSKPDPDIIQAALARAEASAAEAVMIGDTPYDVEAARRAGMDVIAFRCGGWRDADLQGAIAVYDGPSDLLRRLDESPLGDADAARMAAAEQPSDDASADPMTPADDANPFEESSPADDPVQDLDDQDPLAPLRPAWPDEGEPR
jgi:hypothetical protein